jgi:hypothetical protein
VSRESLPCSLVLTPGSMINTAVSDGALAQAFTEARGEGYDVVLDFLWGRPAEILLRTLIPASFAFAKPTRLVQAAWRRPGPRGSRLVVVP